jgi:hypothetical protein
MLSTRVETHEMFRVTYERLAEEYKELEVKPPESLNAEDKKYSDDLIFWMNTKPVHLIGILRKANEYIARNTDKKPSKRLLPFWTPQIIANAVDTGAYYTGVKIHQDEAKSIRNIATIKLNLIRKSEREYSYIRNIIQQALEDFDPIYTTLFNTTDRKGEIFLMLEEIFNAYHYTPKFQRVVLADKELPQNNPPYFGNLT